MFFSVTALAHVALIVLLVMASKTPGSLLHRPVEWIALVNFTDPDELPPVPVLDDPAIVELPVIDPVPIGPPSIEVEGPISDASDQFAGAAPTNEKSSGISTLGRQPIVVAVGRSMLDIGVAAKVADPHSGDEFRIWAKLLQDELKNVNPSQKSTSCKTEVFARPSGGFSGAKVAACGGDLSIDQRVVALLIQHQELIAPGFVTRPMWVTLPEVILTGPAN